MTEENNETILYDKEVILYDADARQRFAFEVTEGGEKFDTAHHYEPLSDERYIKYLSDANIRGDGDEVEGNELEITTNLWSDLVVEVENIEVEDGDDWKALIDGKEKEDSLDMFLAVAVVEPESKTTGKRRLAAGSTEKVVTEAYFNGVPVQQTHVLKKKSDEWQKKYSRIQARRFQPEATKGVRNKPKIKFVPQDEKIGKLYDEQFIEQTGFANGNIPLRFKTRVIHYLYGGTKLDEQEKK